VAVRVRKDGRFAIHSAGKANVGMAEINARCAGSEKYADSTERAAESERLNELREANRTRDLVDCGRCYRRNGCAPGECLYGEGAK
jgi:hypothetical protein